MNKEDINNLKKGDRILLYHMEDINSIDVGSEGIVLDIEDDIFEDDSKIIRVRWDDGTVLSLLSNHDIWKKI